MKNSLFEYKDYRIYLLEYISAQPKKGRGLRQRLANAANCQIGYISHVLSGRNLLSPEQAEAISRILGFTQDEIDFFILLVEYARAGTPSLKKHFSRQLENKKNQYLQLKKQVQIDTSLSPLDQQEYYSKWYYAAIHMLVTIPEYRTYEKIAEYFQMPLSKVRKILEFLIAKNLVEIQRGQLIAKHSQIHLDNDSLLIQQHHTNWRLHAIRSLEQSKEQDMHYSSTFSVSKTDMEKLRMLFTQAIADATKIIKPSKEEALCALCLDVYEV